MIAMFSKEGWVAMVPLGILLAAFRGWSWRKVARRSIPLLVLLGLYAVLWLSNAHRNFFVTDGHYALSWQALPVYFKSFQRVISQAALMLIPFLVWGSREDLSRLFRNRMVQFFLIMCAVSIIPYSFLTYLDHIPSRNTYLPSVGVAGLVGIFFALFTETARRARKSAVMAMFAAILVANGVYIWVKKEPQFRERAAPTRELLAALKESPPSDASEMIYVCGFPLHEWIGQTAVEGFTQWKASQVVFQQECKDSVAGQLLQWDAAEENYNRIGTAASSNN
jgi:hypothetical protein